MYTTSDYWDVEPICYEPDHISVVEEQIKINFPSVFQSFLELEAGTGVSNDQFAALQAHFGVEKTLRSSSKSLGDTYRRLIDEGITEFEKDRQEYLNIFDEESLEEYEDDPNTFKSVILKNKCPIIRKTLANKRAKQLDKYRNDFNLASAEKLLSVVRNLSAFGSTYHNKTNNNERYLTISSYEDLGLHPLGTDDYTAFGVIGGGIKTHMLFKNWPDVFSNRSRNALWALWYLTDKRSFGCHTDSEFLMIDTKKVITQQNYFYPYELFGWYALFVYRMLQNEAEKLGAMIPPEHRYVIVDQFFDFIASQHSEEIDLMQSQIANEGRGYD